MMHKRAITIMTILCLCPMMSACGNKASARETAANSVNATKKYVDVKADSDGNIVIPIEDITASATFYNYVIDDVIVQLVTIRDGDNFPHISFNTCQSCSPSPKAYYVQKEDVLQCANCGSVFAPEDIGLIHGGCNPWPIEEVQIGDESIVIPVASLDSMRNKFTTWKGPTE